MSTAYTSEQQKAPRSRIKKALSLVKTSLQRDKKASSSSGRGGCHAQHELSDDPRAQVKRSAIGKSELIRSVAECGGNGARKRKIILTQ